MKSRLAVYVFQRLKRLGVDFAMRVVVDTAALSRLLENSSKETLNKVADKIVENAQRIVPVDTGELRDSISHEPATGKEVIVRADAPYAAFVELGTSKMAAQPFLRPAVTSVGGTY